MSSSVFIVIGQSSRSQGEIQRREDIFGSVCVGYKVRHSTVQNTFAATWSDAFSSWLLD